MSENDRAEASLRAAMRDDEPVKADPRLEPGAVRDRLRRRRLAGTAVAGAAVIALAVGLVPQLIRPATDGITAQQPDASTRTTTVPAGWRVEQYRTVSIQVPDSWGYAYAPGSAWCSDSPDGRPTPERTKPYVSLGTSSAFLQIGCPPQPDGLLTEHVELTAVSRGVSATPESTSQVRSGWIDQTRTFPAEPGWTVVLRVVSRDRATVDQIVDSARLGGECDATSEVQRVGSRTGQANLDALGSTEELTICQYDPSTDDDPGGLRAARHIAGSPARAVADALAAAITSGKPAATGCGGLRSPALEVAVTIRLVSSAEVFVTAGTCIDPADANTRFGGVDGGGQLRQLTSKLCRQIVQPPLRLEVSRAFTGC